MDSRGGWELNFWPETMRGSVGTRVEQSGWEQCLGNISIYHKRQNVQAYESGESALMLPVYFQNSAPPEPIPYVSFTRVNGPIRSLFGYFKRDTENCKFLVLQ